MALGLFLEHTKAATIAWVVGLNLACAIIVCTILWFTIGRRGEDTGIGNSPVALNTGAPMIPLDVTYSPIGVQTTLPYKREIEVRLNRKVDERELAAIGEKIKSGYPSDCERTFIFYFLPGTTVGKDVCWATTHFSPELNVGINYGGDAAEEERVVEQPVGNTGVTVGEWLDTEEPVGTCKIRIFVKGDQAFIERKWVDGSTGIHPLIESPSADGRRFTAADRSSGSSDYMLIDRSGNLQYRDSQGLIYSVAPTR